MTWLDGVRCACGADDWESVPAPEGVHTISECREPELEARVNVGPSSIPSVEEGK